MVYVCYGDVNNINERHRLVRAVINDATARGLPSIAMGDWNDPPATFALGTWEDAAAHLSPAARVPTTRAGRRIDYAIVDPAMAQLVSSSQTLTHDNYPTHYAVQFTLNLVQAREFTTKRVPLKHPIMRHSPPNNYSPPPLPPLSPLPPSCPFVPSPKNNETLTA